ncbi:hypothetical protein U3653_22265 [Nocardia sp. CDC186]|uniref:Restriction endonuclease n=1 Tax=Nocardia implantans TaxID=3108168 RepID=A0ABU6AZF5_9NOCA|nr:MULTISPECIES: hypothetical protein [unclassified Nocardia]MBF6194150.1 hypothetical protein [Nocardia beijingensis]MEA3529758.1 hypothetical protein [Nocardia sp. CDC192]MEB3512764.1 hypothetical protein [Nocardia sp. CDC186]
MEIRKGGDGLGLYLESPDRKMNGNRDPWYELVSSVRAGETVYHYYGPERRFVGRSVTAADCLHDLSSNLYSVDLTGFTPLGGNVDLAKIRSKAEALYEARDALEAAYGEPLYLPFQFKQDRSLFAPMSNYFAKLPRSFIEILFDDEDVLVQQPKSRGSSGSPREGRRGFLQPFKAKADTDYISNVVGGKSVRTRSHETLVNNFAVWLEACGLVPLRNAAVDLATDEPPVVIEAKTVNGHPADAIRAAVGQLYEYRYFQVVQDDAGLIFLADEAIHAKWCAYLEEDREIGLAWPDGRGFHLSHLAREYLTL